MKTKWTCVVLALVLAGCGTSSEIRKGYTRAATDRFSYEVVNTGGMSPEGLSILKQRLDSTLASINRLAVGKDPDARNVKIEITGYRMRHGATRAMVGILAGRDSITSKVEVMDAAGEVVGQIDIDSKNSTAWGTSKGLIEGHSDEIVEFMTGVEL